MKIVYQARIAGLHGCEIEGECEVGDELENDEITTLIRMLASAKLTVIWTDMRSGQVITSGPNKPSEFIAGDESDA